MGLGASTRNKDWTRAQWIAFIQGIRRRTRGTIFLIGGPVNGPVAAGMIEATAGASMLNACDLTLIESAALLKHADLFVGPNSGPMNIAAAVGTPAFGFFATNKVLTYSRHIHAILPDDGRLAADGMQRLSPLRVATCLWLARVSRPSRLRLCMSSQRIGEDGFTSRQCSSW